MLGGVSIPITLFLAGAYSFASEQYSFRNSTSHHQDALQARQTHIATNFFLLLAIKILLFPIYDNKK